MISIVRRGAPRSRGVRQSWFGAGEVLSAVVLAVGMCTARAAEAVPPPKARARVTRPTAAGDLGGTRAPRPPEPDTVSPGLLAPRNAPGRVALVPIPKFTETVRTAGVLRHYDDDQALFGFALPDGDGSGHVALLRARVVHQESEIGPNTIYEGRYYRAYRVAPGGQGPLEGEFRRHLGREVAIDLGRSADGQLFITSLRPRP